MALDLAANFGACEALKGLDLEGDGTLHQFMVSCWKEAKVNEKHEAESGKTGGEMADSEPVALSISEALRRLRNAEKVAPDAVCPRCGEPWGLHSRRRHSLGYEDGRGPQDVCPAPAVSLPPVTVEPREDVKPIFTPHGEKVAPEAVLSVRSVHFSRADLAVILAERLGIALGAGELSAFWNVTVDGDFRGVTVWL
jgi:hypothetical protein